MMARSAPQGFVHQKGRLQRADVDSLSAADA